jgi:hypothetical protein
MLAAPGGLETVLREVCGLDPESPLGREVVRLYRRHEERERERDSEREQEYARVITPSLVRVALAA